MRRNCRRQIISISSTNDKSVARYNPSLTILTDLRPHRVSGLSGLVHQRNLGHRLKLPEVENTVIGQTNAE